MSSVTSASLEPPSMRVGDDSKFRLGRCRGVQGGGHRFRNPRACAFVLMQMLALESGAASCDPLLNGEPALFETTIALAGADRAKRALAIANAAEILVIARESDVDVTLEVADTSGRLLGRADNPIRRSGIQRVVFKSPGGRYFVDLVGKEHAAIRGRVEVRVLTIALDSECHVALRHLANADAAFSAGQAVTLGTSPHPTANAAKAYADAMDMYKAVASNLGDQPSLLLGQTRHAVATVFYPYLADWSQAKVWAELAADTYSQMGDEYGQARAQAVQAAALMEIAVSVRSDSSTMERPSLTREMLEQARAMLTSLAALHGRRGEPYDQALNLNNLGLAFNYEALNEEASQVFRKVLPLYEQLGERPRQAQVLTNIALAEYELGRMTEAIRSYDQALALITAAEQPRLVAIALQNSALAHWASGNFDAALRQYGEAIELWRKIQDVRGQARALHGIGTVYHTIGDQDLALDFYQQALAMRSAEIDVRGRSASLRAIANILRDQGRAREALKMHEEALKLATTPSIRARMLVQIAKDFDALGQPIEAQRQLSTVLSGQVHEDEVVGGLALLERGKYRIGNGQLKGAEQDLRSALRTFRDYELTADQFSTWLALARLHTERRDVPAALVALDNALLLAEELRVQSANPELRATLLQPLRPAFDQKISLLAQQYFDDGSAEHNTPKSQSRAVLALQTAEQSRARALADFQALNATAGGVDPGLVQEREVVYRSLAARRSQLESRLDRAGTADVQVVTLRAQIADLRSRLDRIDAKIGAASVNRATSNRGAAQSRSIDVRAVPQDTAIVEYWLGADHTVAWVVTRERVIMRRLDTTAIVADAALALHSASRNFASVPERERLRLSERLYELLIKPIEADALGKPKLIFAPDGALHYVPFAVLRSAGAPRAQFLVENHDIAVTPSIHLLLRDDIPRPAREPHKAMLLVADPVYERNDARLVRAPAAADVQRTTADLSPRVLLRAGSGTDALERLPGTAREATAIARLLAGNAVDRLEGFTATRERFMQAGLENYRFIHIASHAVTDSQVPQLSALILSTFDRQGRPIDGRVLAADFVGIQLDADAVILSACDTALGKNVSGEGLVGLRYVMLASGARSVTASLWPVPDEVTAKLMSMMYASLLQRKTSMAAALGEAMRKLIAEGVADPAMWGAFVATVRGPAN